MPISGRYFDMGVVINSHWVGSEDSITFETLDSFSGSIVS